MGFTTQLAFADQAGVPYQTYRQWEIFDAAPSATTLVRALKALGVAERDGVLIWIATGDPPTPRWLEE